MALKILLREARELSSLSLNELGRKAGLSPQFLNRLERGQSSPSLNTIDKICKALGVNPGAIPWIVYEDQEDQADEN